MTYPPRRLWAKPDTPEPMDFDGERFTSGLRGEIEHEHLHRYFAALELCADRAVLDIACGEGYGSSLLGRVAQSVCGVDISTDAIRHAKANYSTDTVTFSEGDATSIPLGDQSVDVVVSFETIEHIHGQEQFLDEIKRVLKQDGILIMSSPDRDIYSAPGELPNPHHVAELNREELLKLIQSRFKNVNLLGQNLVKGSAIYGAKAGLTTQFVEYPYARVGEFEGLDRAKYLIAVASDSKLPELTSSIYDGAVFFANQEIEAEKREAELNSLIEKLQEELYQAEARAESGATRLSDLESSLEEARAAAKKLAHDLTVAQTRSESASEQIDALKAQLREQGKRGDEYKKVTQILAGLKERVEDLKEGVSAARENDGRLLALVASSTAVIEPSEVEELQAAIAKLKCDLDARVGQIAFLEGQISDLNSTLPHVTDGSERIEQSLKLLSEFIHNREATHPERIAAYLRAARQQTPSHFQLNVVKEKVSEKVLGRRLLNPTLTALQTRCVASPLFLPGLPNAEKQRRVRQEWGNSDWSQLLHPLFDLETYQRESGLSSATSKELFLDFLERGGDAGLTTHPLFDPVFYSSQRGSRSTGLSPVEDYVLHGACELLNPHPLFDSKFYVGQGAMSFAAGDDPLSHYMRQGDGLFDPFPLFSETWYLKNNPDVAASGQRGLVHFVLQGFQEGRSPHPMFDLNYYLDSYPDVANGGVNPLEHYYRNGHREGRRPCPGFDPAAYLEANPDVASAGVEPLEHFVRWGMFEGRTPGNGSGARNLSDGESDEQWAQYQELKALLTQDYRATIERFEEQACLPVRSGSENLANAVRSLHFATPTSPSVSIVIPTFNNKRYTVECLMSISRARTTVSYEIIIADDCSEDGTAELLSDIPGINVLKAKKNLGFLRNCNRAAQHAAGQYILFLNNDVQVLDGWLDELLDTLKTSDDIGVAGPKILYPNGRLQEAGARINPDGSAELIGLFENPNLPRYCYDRDVDYVSGACLITRLDDFKELGGFDTIYAPAYYEDSDYCFRLRKKGKRVVYSSKSRVVHHLSVTSQSVDDKYKARNVARNQQIFVERWREELESLESVRTIAFYLPQYHSISENDRWWGKGFTEWTNVTRANPNFVGHYQPQLPADLGFYDLTDGKTLQAQADLARRYGVDGFMFYYYWFNGRRVLERPLEGILEDDSNFDFPFCLCWANENWTRTWDGMEKDVLLEQVYSADDDKAIIVDLMRFLENKNYIRVNGKPLVVIYRPELMPNPELTVERWRRECRERGIGEIYLCFVENFEKAFSSVPPAKWGFDASIEFPPSQVATPIALPGAKLNPQYDGVVNSYKEVVRRYLGLPLPKFTRFRGAMPGWDNTARRQDKSYIYHGAGPGRFQAWLEKIYHQTKQQNFGDEQLIFINAWNEWAEGAHLEPDTRFGHGWLQAIRDAKDAPQFIEQD